VELTAEDGWKYRGRAGSRHTWTVTEPSFRALHLSVETVNGGFIVKNTFGGGLSHDIPDDGVPGSPAAQDRTPAVAVSVLFSPAPCCSLSVSPSARQKRTHDA
jgi:hypothetical protein